MEVIGEEVLDVGLDLKPEAEVPLRRRQLLPWWVKVFSWIFMLVGVIGVISLPFAAFGMTFNLSFYGIETNEPLSFTGLLVISLFIIKGFTAYSLWFEKDWAITLGYIDAVIGMVICLIVMWVAPYFMEGFESEFKVELIFLLAFVFLLKKKQSQWVNSHID